MNFKQLGAELGLEEDEYKELVELFVETGSADFQQLQSALAAADFDQIIRSAHTIKGAAGNLGLMDIHHLAQRIEQLAEGREPQQMQANLQSLASQMETLKALVHS